MHSASGKAELLTGAQSPRFDQLHARPPVVQFATCSHFDLLVWTTRTLDRMDFNVSISFVEVAISSAWKEIADPR